jgi:thiol-disulfide isomerase/thioredoxin
MRRLVAVLLLLGLAAPAVRAQQKPGTKSSPAFQALKDEYERAQKQHQEAQKKVVAEAMKAFQAAKTEEEKKAAQKKMMVNMTDGPGAKFSARFLAFAEKNPDDPSAVDALVMALQTSGGPKSASWIPIVERLRTGYAARPEIKQVVRQAGGLSDEAVDKLMQEVLAKNPDRKIQALACKALAASKKSLVQMAQELKKNDVMRARAEEQFGKPFVQRFLDHADKAPQEAEALTKLLKEKYADVYPDLSVGKAAPEVVSQDLAGKETRLSALKGKVVVLDIWATWCGPCRAMIPHERDMVERLKGKPFVLVSISTDAKKETLTDFLKTEKMPWTHWWNGAEGGIVDEWDVQYYPTIYVLDAQGVIRHRDLRGEQLERAVNDLLKEMETKKVG